MKEKSQLEVLYRISRALVGKQNLDDVLHQIVTLTADLIGSKICSLMLMDEKKDQLVVKATQSLSTAYLNKPPVRAGHSVSGRVIKRKEPIQVTDVKLDASFGSGTMAKEEGICSLLSVPMMMGEEAIGVLNCYTEEQKVFSGDEIKLIQTIANQAAIAIEHMRVVSQEAEARNTLETKVAVDKAKRILMKEYKMNEAAAHRYMQKMSMEKSRPIKEIAQAFILATDLVQGKSKDGSA